MDQQGGFISSQDIPASQGDMGDAAVSVPCLKPVMLRQVKRAVNAGDIVTLDGKELKKIKFYARILEIKNNENQVRFHLEDGTGDMWGSQWNSNDGEGDGSAGFTNGMYVAVFGQVKPFKNAVMLNIDFLKPLKSHNELTHHFLDVILTHLQSTQRLCNPVLAKAAGNMHDAMEMDPAGSTSMYGSQAAGVPGVKREAIVSSNPAEANLDTKVMEIFNQPEVEDLDEGLDANQVLEKLKGCPGYTGTGLEIVKKCIDGLALEGHLYSTVDEDHFKSTGDS
mmetsp:Transcript_20058/g.33114  ORF Transcript_20058/g.33114 Transcript_20058/m.33114 type:complete len:280 (+) Transcript_20058:52-891(+)